MILVKGDRFIYYGDDRTVKGVVDRVVERSALDLIHAVKITKVEIFSESGERFDLNKCRKIEKDLLPSFIRRVIGS